MKIIVMSDSHGDKETVRTVSALHADAIFHCGDSELTVEDPVLQGMHIVRGNCDSDLRFPSSFVIEVGEKRVFVVHGHEHDCKRTLLPLYYAAQEEQADIVLFGHSHLYGTEMKEGILFLNPGSTLLPRGGNEATFAVIEWDETIRISFKNLALETINEVEIKNFLN
ncbi:metallophosphoesterase [Sporosarcina oncorhynchi]|uniref:Phosphoesterase n=1 Tax=Sporosarcina oncorhynchi TaxID=3056444 RepID=A0ABZ0L814_9BACL|nr:metallophosphoesterase [Sporosarcina sp. T2O-4]WOV88673.1 metallophosphoesterase [Sporosarcina sp. T2O-4]